MNIPNNLRYTKSHEWVREDDGVYYIGITDYAQNEMGDIVFVELPSIGDEFTEGDIICTVESVKAVSDVYSPVSGVVQNVNEALEDAPELVNQDPYGSWFAELIDVEPGRLLSPEEYKRLIEEE